MRVPARNPLLVLLVALVAALAGWLRGGPGTGSKGSARPPPVSTTGGTPREYRTTEGTRITAPDEVRGIADTLQAIAQGPPYPFARDGIVYHNRNGALPSQPDGTYREFTVVTPGRSDRGPRRLVRDPAAHVWYTRDHYETFVQLVLR